MYIYTDKEITYVMQKSYVTTYIETLLIHKPSQKSVALFKKNTFS